jgi:hypothetical protein
VGGCCWSGSLGHLLLVGTRHDGVAYFGVVRECVVAFGVLGLAGKVGHIGVVYSLWHDQWDILILPLFWQVM